MLRHELEHWRGATSGITQRSELRNIVILLMTSRRGNVELKGVDSQKWVKYCVGGTECSQVA